ncbi:putative peptidoglycan binding domain protein [Variibacter gotjawalensis]|uniref:Putative peptidoglycan binding domain protein n=1 Tax=Variibacter gotjawalensis TaxID=1333996 RepID=A0A0S3PZ90_9BRAD|nr:peptidoglycan-binding protein [Variibacter gotjawalensis]NIK47098.1 peptidoglycan hydrolase-like protein with peptidoglycan-binding domain [Variibacter gotjawalensis]RZS49000.1 peptidoglycan hydrolase-like protein with peptidoglycan-binding domain [Variibacter gotjawalensis]BAT61260.1 putative peptidoglycan binding domain protein [Variibacter gotjawalensis]
MSRFGEMGGALWRKIARRPVDSLALVVALGVVTTIVVNAVALQASPHPAPIAKPVPMPVPKPQAATAPVQPKAVTTGSVAPNEPQVAAVSPNTKEPVMRTRVQLLTEIQKELARRGFYDGTVDGVMGPKMEAAIRAFEQSARLRVTGEANEALLKALQRAPAKAKSANAENSTKRIVAVQRALTDFGYGPVPPTGVFGEATRAAVEKFERDRKLTPTGRISERVLKELAAVTGRSFE